MQQLHEGFPALLLDASFPPSLLDVRAGHSHTELVLSNQFSIIPGISSSLWQARGVPTAQSPQALHSQLSNNPTQFIFPHLLLLDGSSRSPVRAVIRGILVSSWKLLHGCTTKRAACGRGGSHQGIPRDLAAQCLFPSWFSAARAQRCCAAHSRWKWLQGGRVQRGFVTAEVLHG